MANAKNAIESSAATDMAAVGGIDEILSTLDVGGEIIENAASDELVEEAVIDLEIEAAKTRAQEGETVAEGEAPVEATDKPAKSKGKKAKSKDTPASTEPAEKKARVFFSKQSDRIAHNLGEKVSEMMLLEVGDAALSGDDLKAKNAEVMELIDGTAKKVGEKANMLFKYMSKGGELNEVMKRAFQVLAKDGELTSGEKGNLQLNLLSKPYSLGTARSQSNQMFMLLPALKVTLKEKGKMVPNPNSLILAKINSMLGL